MSCCVQLVLFSENHWPFIIILSCVHVACFIRIHFPSGKTTHQRVTPKRWLQHHGTVCSSKSISLTQRCSLWPSDQVHSSGSKLCKSKDQDDLRKYKVLDFEMLEERGLENCLGLGECRKRVPLNEGHIMNRRNQVLKTVTGSSGMSKWTGPKISLVMLGDTLILVITQVRVGSSIKQNK